MAPPMNTNGDIHQSSGRFIVTRHKSTPPVIGLTAVPMIVAHEPSGMVAARAAVRTKRRRMGCMGGIVAPLVGRASGACGSAAQRHRRRLVASAVDIPAPVFPLAVTARRDAKLRR